MNISITNTLELAAGKAYQVADSLLDKLPEDETKPEPCLKTWMCDCERRSCPGRTLSSKYYTRKLKDAR